jgi:transcriptional regulator with PAS, ATPase and Fis domain
VPVNCAAIPETMAERLLFGARKGSYSGATADAQGFIAAAEGGVLFLDEVGELSLDTQAKLLRFLETREIVPLGATRPQRVDVRVVCATHRDLRKSIAAERFRADLYYRLAQLTVTLPALRDRLEEVPWLVAEALARFGAPGRSTPGLVEACMTRPWPGNVRELLGALRTAVHAAHDAPAVTAAHLPEGAGLPLESDVSSEAPASSVVQPSAPPATLPPSSDDQRAAILAALDRCGGNQALAAAQLGLSRRTFIRRLESLQVPRPRLTARALKGTSGA